MAFASAENTAQLSNVSGRLQAGATEQVVARLFAVS